MCDFNFRETELVSNLSNRPPIYKKVETSDKEFKMKEINEDDRYLEPVPKFPPVKTETFENAPMLPNVRYSAV